MIILLVVIGVAILIFNIWNIVVLRRLNNSSTAKDIPLNDAKYYELKYKSEFIVAVFSVIVAVGGLLGYESLQSAKNEVKSDLLTKMRSIDSLVTQTELRIKRKDSLLFEIESKQDIINSAIPINEEKLQKQNVQLRKLMYTINDLNDNNKIKQSFYLVRDLKIKNNKGIKVTTQEIQIYRDTLPPEKRAAENGMKKTLAIKQETGQYYKFDDLKTNLGDKLPKFTKIPFIISIPESSFGLEIYNVTLDGFYVDIASGTKWSVGEEEIFNFSLMIIENK